MKKLVISGGIYKNKKITCPPGEIRPVMSLVREAMFQILEHHFMVSLEHCAFLDLFSGSGLMSIEAVSRGAQCAVSVEIDRKKWPVIQNNFSIQKEKFTLVREPAERFLLKNSQKFNVIYVDPPFNYRYKNDLMKKIINSKAIDEHTIISIHMPRKEPLASTCGSFIRVKERNYGGSALYFYRDVQYNI